MTGSPPRALAAGPNAAPASSAATSQPSAAPALTTSWHQGKGVEGKQTLTRVNALVLGLISPRAGQNIFIRLFKTKGLRAFKVDLRPNIVTLDFEPGREVSKEEVNQIMLDAGWTPKSVRIQQIPVEQAVESGSGWFRVPHFNTDSAFWRWVYLNFTWWTKGQHNPFSFE